VAEAGRKRVMTVIGTRPEAIKMAPVIAALDAHRDAIDSCIVSTGQHREMLDQVLGAFRISPATDLDLMRPDQSLTAVTVGTLEKMERLLAELRPDLLLVQGDTTTTFAAGLAAFYGRIPVAHVEAGLRTSDKGNPYPEEINRRLTSCLADYHFAPTPLAVENLLRENIPRKRIVLTGNTIVDAVGAISGLAPDFRVPEVDPAEWAGSRLVVVTAHRRENWGRPLEDICGALRDLLHRYADIRIIFPVHLNPNVRRSVACHLPEHPRLHVIEPLEYFAFIGLMKQAHLILTDSGGIQEEAPSLGKPVIVLRHVTERPEASASGMAVIAGTKRSDIVACASRWLAAGRPLPGGPAGNPYGDGRAARRIVTEILRILGLSGSRHATMATRATGSGRGRTHAVQSSRAGQQTPVS
jgi:UDP-N-acetylglucosamine 2-epimerase (non-hydrolysing)